MKIILAQVQVGGGSRELVRAALSRPLSQGRGSRDDMITQSITPHSYLHNTLIGVCKPL